MTDREYQDWHQDVSNKVAGFLVQEISRIEAADLATRALLSKVIVRAFWGEAKSLVGRLAPKVLDNVLDCVSDVSLNDLVSMLSRIRRNAGEQEGSSRNLDSV